MDAPPMIGPVEPDMVTSSSVEAKKSEYAIPMDAKSALSTDSVGDLKPSNSEFVASSLREFVTLSNLPMYQKTPTPVKPDTAPPHGDPISSQELKDRIERLESAVYMPMIVDGKLYFVSQDNDTRTARADSPTPQQQARSPAPKHDSLPTDVTFTFGQLTAILGPSMLKKIVDAYNSGQIAPASAGRNLAPAEAIQMQNALNALNEDVSTAREETVRTARSRGSPSSRTTPYSRRVSTAVEKTDGAKTPRTAPYLWDDELMTATSVTRPDVMTGIPRSSISPRSEVFTARSGDHYSYDWDDVKTAKGKEATDDCTTARSAGSGKFYWDDEALRTSIENDTESDVHTALSEASVATCEGV